MRIRPILFPRFAVPLLALLLLLSASSPLHGDDRWQAIHRELHDVLAGVSQARFRAAAGVHETPTLPELHGQALPSPWMIVVGFTGGIEGRESTASGVVAMRRGLGEYVGERQEVAALTFNNFHWREAARDVAALVRDARARNGGGDPLLPQPLIVVYGHSWGAGSIAKFARDLRRQELEISLAIYIDAFTLRNPRLPDNVRYAVNFYQRGGILRGLPFRGKRRLIPQDRQATQVLGEYRIKPLTEKWGWSWNLLQPLLYRHHHRIGHDLRLQRYLLEIINLKLQLLDQSQEAVARRHYLFDKVVILGASVSANERAPSPGLLLAQHLGTPAERIQTFAVGGAPSDRHLPYLDNIARLQPTVILALDLFYHDFKLSLFLSESRKKYLRDYITRLHDTGAVVVVGNVPSLVLLRHHHVNRYLEELAAEFPNLVVVDVDRLLHGLDANGFSAYDNGRTVVLTKDDLFADRVHPNLLGSTIMANLMRQELQARFPELWPEGSSPLPLPLNQRDGQSLGTRH